MFALYLLIVGLLKSQDFISDWVRGGNIGLDVYGKKGRG